MWETMPERTRADLLSIWRDLQVEHDGIRGRVARRYLKSVVEVWAVTDAVSEEAAKVAHHRQHAKGRRVTAQRVRLAAKRQSMQMVALDQALAKLRTLATKTPMHALRRRA